MKTCLLALMSTLYIPLAVSGMLIFDFAEKDATTGWRIINDTVMGGLSRSEFVPESDSTAVFRGVLSLENYGGFASVRSRVSEYDLSDYDGFELRVRGDGRRYQLRVRVSGRFDGIAYKREFDTVKDQWITVRAPFSEFTATYRGRTISDFPALDPSMIRQIGFLIADKDEGRFELEVKSVGTWSEGE